MSYVRYTLNGSTIVLEHVNGETLILSQDKGDHTLLLGMELVVIPLLSLWLFR